MRPFQPFQCVSGATISLQNPANRAENLIRLCSATIGQTGWRMVQFGAIRSRPKGVFSVFPVLFAARVVRQCSECSEKPRCPYRSICFPYSDLKAAVTCCPANEKTLYARIAPGEKAKSENSNRPQTSN